MPNAGSMAFAHLFMDHFDAATSWAEKALQELPTFLLAAAALATSHALVGRMAQARG
ncbi:MAG: hypothetical protein Q7U82_12265 [Gammaproteobacteria bacterium]|nr:hypothetical protein [Gammaproteobacteria bacterium]